MKKDRLTDKFLEELERTPVVQIACEKVGVSRNTVYRWIKEDVDFRVRFNDALSVGEDVVSDVAESNVLHGIRNKDFRYTNLWLATHHPRYRRPQIFRPAAADEAEEERKREKAKKRAAEILAMFDVPVIEDSASPPSGKRPSRRK